MAPGMQYRILRSFGVRSLVLVFLEQGDWEDWGLTRATRHTEPLASH